MTNEEKIKLLQNFCDPAREEYSKPFQISDGRICATNAYVLVITTGHTDVISEMSEKAKKVYHPNGEYIRFSLNGIIRVYESLPDTQEKMLVECKECSGSGSVEFIYESNSGRDYHIDADCPICEGKGGCHKQTGRIVKDTNSSSFNIMGVHINPKFINSIGSLSDGSGFIDIIPENGRIFFRIGEFEGLIMGMTEGRPNQIQINPVKS